MFGMVCFRSQGPHLHGTIKSLSADFQVTEIDQSGRLVQLNNLLGQGNITGKCGSASNKGTSRDVEGHNLQGYLEVVDVVQSGRSIGRNQGDRTHEMTLSELGPSQNNEVSYKYVKQTHSENGGDSMSGHKNHMNNEDILRNLDGDLFEKIQQYSDQVLRLSVGSSSVAAEDDTILASVSLGVFHDKGQRSSIYTAVKELFPHLKASLDKGHEMKILQDEVYLSFRSLLPKEDCDNLMRFVVRRHVGQTLDLCDIQSKAVRTKVHRLINQYHGSLVESKTFTDDSRGSEKTFIQLRVKEKTKGQKRKLDSTNTGGSYTGFTLWKDNLETLDAIHTIARVLGVQPSDISYAGIKDKKAITIQAMAVSRPYQRVLRALNDFHEQGIKVGNIHERTGPIATGELWGNHFRVIVRDVRLGEESSDNRPLCRKRILEGNLKERLTLLKTEGFINYFGEQRFGEEWPTSQTGSLTADVGLALLKKDYEKAVHLILTPDTRRDDAVNRAKRLFQETNDAKGALKLMPSYKARECTLLKALHRHGLDQEGCRKALLAIPHRMRQLYIHSFTSLVWNHMATQRITDHGFKVIQGDLVSRTEFGSVKKDEVKAATADDISDLKYTFRNVVLPLPGNMIQLPRNDTGDVYNRLMNDYGLGQSCQFRLNALQVNVPGEYRRIIEAPQDLDWMVDCKESGQFGDNIEDDFKHSQFTKPGGVRNSTESSDGDLMSLDHDDIGGMASNEGGSTKSGIHAPALVKTNSGEKDITGTITKYSECVGKGRVVEQQMCDHDSSRFERTSVSEKDARTKVSPSEVLNQSERCENPLKATKTNSSNISEHASTKVKFTQLCECGLDVHPCIINLELDFKLPSSTYATSFLREIVDHK